MSTQSTQFYLIRALTNLHPGAGDANFGIIDKHVQRDPLTGLPTIFASSLKGSLRELLTVNGIAAADIKNIFGSDNARGTQAGEADLQQGSFIFYAAKLLGLPIRSSHSLYYIATTPALIQELLNDAALFGMDLPERTALEELLALESTLVEGKPLYGGNDQGVIQLEDLAAQHKAQLGERLGNMFGPRLALLHINDFQQLAEALPTVARNSLDNGKSINLWYEEIVPRESRFYTAITAMNSQPELLEQGLEQQKHLVQLGGNATVGNGLCQWKNMGSNEK